MTNENPMSVIYNLELLSFIAVRLTIFGLENISFDKIGKAILR